MSEIDTGNNQESNNDTSEATFTQDQVNAIVAERVQRVKKGFEDYEALKEQANAFAAYKEAEQERLDAAKQEAATEALNAVTAERNQERIESLIALEAKGLFADTSDALLHLKDSTSDFINEDNTVNAEAIKTAVGTLLEQKPHLRAQGPEQPGLLDVGLGRDGSAPPMTSADQFKAFMQTALSNN